MSDDRDEPKAGKKGGVIPPELLPFLGQRSWPKAQQLGEDPELDAAAAAFRALDHERPSDEPPPVQDLSIGMGNASVYVGPTEVKPANVPAGEHGPAMVAPPKVEIALVEEIVDEVRALPAGNPTRETVETRVLRFAPGEEDEATLRRPPGGRTVGGGTERLPVVKTPSPPAGEAAGMPVAPVEVPSAHGAPPEPASRKAPGGRGRGKGFVLAAMLVGVGGFIALRVFTTSTERPGDSSSPTAMPGTDSGTVSASAAPAMTSPAPPAISAPSAQPATSAAVPEPQEASTSASPHAPPTSSGGRHPPGKPAPPYDPYDAAVAPSPPVTAAPTTPPPPPVPPPPASVTPKPTASPAADTSDMMYTRPRERKP